MTPWLAQLRHEWRVQCRRPFVILCALIYFAIAFGDAYQAGLAGDGFQWINGADAIATRSVILSLFGILAIAGILGYATSLDRDTQNEELVLTATADRLVLGLPRFLIGWLIAVFIGACFIPGMHLGSLMPGIAPESRGPTVYSHYFKGIAYFILPNFYIISAFVFAVGSRFRSQAVTWLMAVGLLVVWILTRMLLGQDIVRHDVFPIYALLEPFGTTAAAEFAMTWTVEQNNSTFVPLSGLLLWNRLLWCSLATGLLVYSLRTLPLRPRSTSSSRCARKSRLYPRWLPSGPLLISLRWELLSLSRQPGLKIFLALASLSLWLAASSASTHQFSLPTTDLLVHNTGFYFDKILTLVLVWSAADLIHREKHHRVHEITHTLPVPIFTFYLAKTLTLLLIILTFWLMSVVVNLAYQAAHGFYHFQIPLLLADSFFIKAPYYLFMAVLALSLQAIVRHRYLAMGLFLLTYLLPVMLDGLGFYHPLFRYGESNFFWYSLMDGYGHFLKGHSWFLLHWTLAALLLWTISAALVTRGTLPPSRISLLKRARLTIPLVLLLAFTASGLSIWYQTASQNQWPLLSSDRIKADIEKQLGPVWKDKAQPRVIGMSYDLEIFPDERRFALSGSYTIHNPSQEEIREVLLLTEPGLTLENVTFPEHSATLVHHDRDLHSQHWSLTEALPPGARTTMTFATSWAPKPGFRARAQNDGINEVGPTEILGNGTSILNLQILPALGYTDRVEHKPRWKRRKYDLPLTWKPPSEERGRNQAHDTLHLDWVEQIKATITTSADQLPLHAGRIIADRTLPDGRRRLEYLLDRPSRGWSEILSGRYTTRTFPAPTAKSVPLTFYYDPRYAYTLDRMGEEFSAALAHFADTYGPPPFDHFRLAQQSLHFDGLGNRAGLGFATEILGWKSDLKLSKGDDLAKMASHMMGMSWFGDQLIPANLAGAKIIHAGLPYWSAGLYLHERRGPHRSRELRRQAMQEFFRKRGSLADEESPFILEHKDSTILRAKGLILTTYLAELTSPATLQSALRAFLDRHRYQKAPYPTAEDFLIILAEYLPAEHHPLLDDIFRKITRWDLRLHSASTAQMDDGRWQTTFEIEAHKFHLTGLGKETEAPLKTPLFLALSPARDLSEGLIHQTLIRPPSGRSTHTLITPEKPSWIHLDPDFLLPDSNLNDQASPIR